MHGASYRRRAPHNRGMTALGPSPLATGDELPVPAARAAIAAALPAVHWPGMQVRRDIGLKALRHAEAGKTVQDPW